MSGGTNNNGQLNTSDSSAVGVVAVTASDSTVFNPPLRGLYVGTTGAVAVTCPDLSTAVFTAVPAGLIIPVLCSKVLATGTTASTIIGLV